MPVTVSVPTWVEVHDRHLAVHVHEPRGDARGLALVLPALGRESTVSFRAVRALAVDLVRAGYLVVRCDISGLGDSAGVVLSDDVGAQWQEDVRGVAHWMRTSFPDLPLNVVGLRLGASLAASLADVCDGSVVAWAPVKPSLWLRSESVARKVGVDLPPVDDPDVREYLGWACTSAQAASLKSMPSVNRDSVAVVEPGADEAPFWAGEPHFATVPRGQLAQIVSHMTASPHPRAVSWVAQPMCTRVTDSGRTVREEWVEIGPHGLPAVWTVPVGGEVRQVVVTTAGGAEPKYGPGGFWASLAVELGAAGVATLRAERRHAGELSDPAEPAEPNPYFPGAQDDVADALRWVSQREPQAQVIGTGLCIAGWMFTMASGAAPVDRVIAFNNAAWQPALGFYARLDRKQQLTASLAGNKVSPDGVGHGADERPWWAVTKRVVKGVARPALRSFPLPVWRALARAQVVQYPADLWRTGSTRPRFDFHFGGEDADIFTASRGLQAFAALRARGVHVTATRWDTLDHSLLALSSRRTASDLLREALGLSDALRGGHPLG